MKGFNNTLWACQRKTPLHGPNDDLVELLLKIQQHRYLTANERGALSYSRAISVLRSYPKAVGSVQEAAALNSIGPTIARLIGEYLQTGRIREVETIEADAEIKALNELTKIYGIGPGNAMRFLHQGIRSAEELRSRVEKDEVSVPAAVVVGLKYYEDLQHPMDRPTLEAMANEITATLDAPELPTCRSIIVGGYRRGKTHNNDLDLLISPTEQEGIDGILCHITRRLQSLGKLVAILNCSGDDSSQQGDGQKSSRRRGNKGAMGRLDRCLGVFKSSSDQPGRRVDIIVAPRSHYAFALLGWTGSGPFERSIRRYADQEKGMTLSSHALTNNRTGETISAETEEEIFSVLGLEFIPPEYRNC